MDALPLELFGQTSSDDGAAPALIFSAVAAAIALAALAHSIITSRHERRDRRRELDLLEQQIADERQRHEEQLALERERRDQERQAELVARQSTISGGDSVDQHQIHLTNGGRATARAIRVRVVGEVGEDLTSEFPVHDLAPDTSTSGMWIGIPAASGRGQRRIFLQARWQDAAGDHDEQLLELRPLR